MVNPEQERRALLAAHVQRLVSTPEWDFFQKELAEIERTVLESLATVGPEFLYTQGILHGIRRVKNLPQTLIAQGRR